MNRSVKSAFALAFATAFLLTGAPAKAEVSARIAADGEAITLTNANSRKCLTVAGGSTANLARAVQYNCDGHASRTWVVSGSLGGNFRLVNLNSGRCLTVDGGSTANNAPVVQYTCDTHAARYWRVINNNGSTLQVRNVNSGKCLTIAGGSTANNAAAVQYTCDTHLSRRWY
ncbi:RICIN domain-containing protein [Micromonospora sp. H61]|uniref:RICIN domain-containing protein n=1 Tax=Micromonospora sp. H61 TaxID=2824888 RepID=UPI001B38B37C|nr:RICIN domain-containing protein [Micromonospora sp. H61]MBQ0988769.1 RICIN domain-containing protein [Micromonospora sp. H61]